MTNFQDPEDGFDPSIDKLLTCRRNDTRVNNWETLWKVLFGIDDPVLPPGKNLSVVNN